MRTGRLVFIPFLLAVVVAAATNLVGKTLAKPQTRVVAFDRSTSATPVAFDIRRESYAILHNALPVDRRERTQRRRQHLQDIVRNHKRLHKHPILPLMYNGSPSPKAVLDLHRDFQYLTKCFTDQITLIALGTRELRPKFGDDVAMAARFLVFLNLLDELGFHPGVGEYRGSPMMSHHMLFTDVLAELSTKACGGCADNENSNQDQAAKHSSKLLGLIDDSNLLSVLAYLIVTEEEAMVFSPAMRCATANTGINVDNGYYVVHGSSDDNSSNACDDFHQNDGWEILELLMDSMNEEEFKVVETMIVDFLDAWCCFWDSHYENMKSKTRTTEIA